MVLGVRLCFMSMMSIMLVMCRFMLCGVWFRICMSIILVKVFLFIRFLIRFVLW